MLAGGGALLKGLDALIHAETGIPATLTERAVTIPPRDIIATSLVPPPISTIMLPIGSATGRPAPIAA